MVNRQKLWTAAETRLTSLRVFNYDGMTGGWVIQEEDLAAQRGGFFDGMCDNYQGEPLFGLQLMGEGLQIFTGGCIQG